MIDKLGGILIGGLLGNGPSSLILGKFNLGFLGIQISVGTKGKPIIWPGHQPDDKIDEDKYLTFKITLDSKIIEKNYKLSNNQANVLIKLNESVKNFIGKTSVFVDKFISKPIKRVFKIKLKD